MDPALLKARQEFTPVPSQSRQSPGRVTSISARLYVDQYLEHKLASDFLDQVQKNPGEGTKTLVRALLYYKETVIQPLKKLRSKDIMAPVPQELMIGVIEFTAIPDPPKKQHAKNVGARLYIDRFMEHRQAYAFLQEMQKMPGEGNKAVVRALLHYKEQIYDRLIAELETQSAKAVHTRTRSSKKGRSSK
jgi:hypothetical protein